MSQTRLIARTVATALLPISVAGCAGVDILDESAHCAGGRERQARLIGNEPAYATLWSATQMGPSITDRPRVDLTQRRVLFLADSEYPTAGHGLRLASPTLTIDQGIATLDIEVSSPMGMTAQIVTRPCLWLSLPSGAYTRVEARDQSGTAWASARLDE
jgi:hypothetical protein